MIAKRTSTWRSCIFGPRPLMVAAMVLAMAACGGGYGGGGSSSMGSSGPTIAAQPKSVSVAMGQTATFSVTATGSGTLSYQWLLNGTAVSGAMAASYTTPPIALADNGSQYAVRVSNSYGTVTSSPAMLSVM